HDPRDYAFSKHFNLPIIQVIEGGNIEEGAHEGKGGTIMNSDFMDGLEAEAAKAACISRLEAKGIGKGKITYRIRDAVFSRQRYWGEPVPVYFKENIPHLIPEHELPVILPEIDQYLPTETGEPPLGRAADWKYEGAYSYELSTMPGWAGSSWYFYRYMDPKNDQEFASKEALNYWQDVDLYIGGSEHATGHLLYSRFWNKFLFDLDLVPKPEPFKKLINQGMIQGRSNFVYRVNGTNQYVSYHLRKKYEVTALYVDVNIVENDVLDIAAFKNSYPDRADATFILEDGLYICGNEIENMSKSKYDVVNADDIVARFGADTLRVYDVLLGTLEQCEPWDTNGIDGVAKFIRKFWRLFHNDNGDFVVSDEKATTEELKIIHKAIKKVKEDIERFAFNTSVSTFMICTNELSALKCNKREVLEPFVLVISPYAPHIAEELWSKLGH